MELLIKLAEQSPIAVALIVVVYMFQNQDQKKEAVRTANAKEIEQQRKDHDAAVNNMWVRNITALMENQNKTFDKIAAALAEHERSSKERYDRLGITQDLIDTIKAQQHEK